jgi:hypothetical protein
MSVGKACNLQPLALACSRKRLAIWLSLLNTRAVKHQCRSQIRHILLNMRFKSHDITLLEYELDRAP